MAVADNMPAGTEPEPGQEPSGMADEPGQKPAGPEQQPADPEQERPDSGEQPAGQQGSEQSPSAGEPMSAEQDVQGEQGASADQDPSADQGTPAEQDAPGDRDGQSDQDAQRGAWSAATDDLSRAERTRPVTKTPASRPGIREAPPGGAGRPAVRRSESARSAQGGPAQGRPQPRGRDQRGADSSAEDLLAGLQRWLIRSSARTVHRELKGQVRRSLGGGRSEPQDIWGTATTEPPPDLDQAPECAWCPICRAARRMRDGSPGLGPQLSSASDAVAAAVHDALGALDGVLSRAAAPPATETPADRSQDHGDADSAASDAAEGAAEHEPGDRS